jgi:hypothetical protein
MNNYMNKYLTKIASNAGDLTTGFLFGPGWMENKIKKEHTGTGISLRNGVKSQFVNSADTTIEGIKGGLKAGSVGAIAGAGAGALAGLASKGKFTPGRGAGVGAGVAGVLGLYGGVINAKINSLKDQAKKMHEKYEN